jgi:hypothetical protein
MSAMTRSRFVSLWVFAAVCGAGPLVAAETTPVLKEPAPAPSPPSPARPRPVSPAVAAQLSAAVPKFENIAPAPAKPAETAPDLRETDKPRNTIVRLPSYVVEEEKAPVFKERELLTPRGRLDLALKRHPGLRLGSFWIFRNDGIALAMLEEEEQLERKKEMQDLLSLLSVAQTKEVKPLVADAFLRK